MRVTRAGAARLLGSYCTGRYPLAYHTVVEDGNDENTEEVISHSEEKEIVNRGVAVAEHNTAFVFVGIGRVSVSARAGEAARAGLGDCGQEGAGGVGGCEGARVRRCEGARACDGARVRRCEGARARGRAGARVRGCAGARVRGYPCHAPMSQERTMSEEVTMPQPPWSSAYVTPYAATSSSNNPYGWRGEGVGVGKGTRGRWGREKRD